MERKWFEVWGTEVAQNRFLKGILALMVAICVVQTCVVALLALKAPILVAISPTSSQVLILTSPATELLKAETVRLVTEYVRLHHNWDWQDIETQIKAAASYVGPTYTKAFIQANAAQVKIAKEKKLSQKFFISSVTVDSDAQTALVEAERLLVIDSLRAANPMTLKVSFSFGNRTSTNPEGIYITAEDLQTEEPKR